jgi:hypothetical protein
MSFESVTDQKLQVLRDIPKRLTNPQHKKKAKEGHEELNYLAINADAPSLEEAQYRFMIFIRKNLKDPKGFSCGILWQSGGELLTLARYNGANHRHDPAVYQCHVHKMREQDLRQGKKEPTFVEVTNSFKTVEGAFHQMAQDFHITGITTTPDDPDLFNT